MKKWSAFTAIFFTGYLAFLVATMPLALLINNIELPKNLNMGSVSGSVWQGEISQISANNYTIEKITTELSFWSLLLFSPTIDVSFGEAMLAGAEGKFTLTLSAEQLLLKDVELFVSANDIAKQLTLPIPVTAQGNVELTLAELNLNTSEKMACEYGQGQISWLQSGVTALDNHIKSGTIKADIDCDKGDLRANISAKNDLGLSFIARLSIAKQKASGQGYLKPGANFPTELESALPFLGRPDNQGRYPLKF
ncbi:MAG: type II secretion system protein N [Colwellia sp.]